MDLIKKHLVLSSLVLLIILTILFILGETAVKNIAQYIPPTPTQTAAVSDFNSSLVAHYTFDDTVTDSAGSNNGTSNGGATYVEGKIGRAIQFDGIDDYINAGTGANLTGALTISAWVNARSSASNDFIAARGNSAGGTSETKQFLLYYYAPGRAGFQVSNGTGSLTTRSATGSVPDGLWTHVAGVYDGSGEVRMYVNGVESGKNTLSGFGALNSAAIGLGMGARQTGSTVALFDGSMDDLRIYNRALSVSEIQQLYGNNETDEEDPEETEEDTPDDSVPNNPPNTTTPPTTPAPVPSLSIDLVQLQAGSFRMGDILGDFGSSHLPVRQVTLNKFSISKYETSNNQAIAALQYAYNNGRITIHPTHVALVGKTEPLFGMGYSDNEIIFNNGVFSVRSGRGSHPAARISWYGAVALANWFSEMQGLDPVYNLNTWTWDRSKGGYRLPTEAEWEYAARGGYDGLRFPWGNTISHDQANYVAAPNTYAFDVNSTPGYHPSYSSDSIKSAPVNSFAPNNYGLYNMAGNAWEWVWDWSARYNATDTNNPIGPTSGTAKIFRGGAWMPTAERASVAFRYQGSNMTNTIFDVGARFVCTSCTGGSIAPPPQNPTAPNPVPGASVIPAAGNITYYVSTVGNDSGPGTQSSPLKTIQKCADVARPGNTCVILAGTYDRTEVRQSGSSGSLITFSAQPGVTSNGFYVRSANYIKIDGFTFTGNVTTLGSWMVEVTGNNAEISNNRFTGTFTSRLSGMIGLGINKNNQSSNGRVSRNIIENWTPGSSEPTAIQAAGSNNIVEYNIIRNSWDVDIFQAFGSNNTFRYNTVVNIKDGPVQTHIDFVQTFGNNDEESYNISFENNFVSNIEGGQIAQMAQSCGLNSSNSNVQANLCGDRPEVNGSITAISGSTITDSSKNWITGSWNANHWQGKVITLVSGSARGRVFLVTANGNNTLTLQNPEGGSANMSGIAVGDRYEIRMRVGWWTFKNNVFHDIDLQMSSSMPHLSLLNNTFANVGGTVFSGGSVNRGRSVNGKVVNNIHVSSAGIYGPQAPGAYPAGDFVVRDTFYADYNYSSGLSYETKRESRCPALYPLTGDFCEAKIAGAHGINGGDPQFKNPSNPLGPDGLAFTTDDGLIPAVGSRLCSAGLGGGAIGAYSCSGGVAPSPNPTNPNPPLPEENPTTPEEPPVSTNCSATSVRCVDDTAGATQEYATVQACATAAQAGDICLVHTGNYPEHVQTARGGTSANKLVFKAQGTATIEGFRVMHPYVTIDGFDITKYATGVHSAHIDVEPAANYCTIQNNTIRDGVQLISNNFSFNGSNRTITNPGGGFVAAGFKPGTKFYIASNIQSLIQNHDRVRTAKSVTDNVITLEDSATLITEGPVHALLYATRGAATDQDRGKAKNGVKGIDFTVTSALGGASNCLIKNNKISNLGGGAISIAGGYHTVENNVIEKMNGWGILQINGNNTTFRNNYIKNSPRYPGLKPPVADDDVDQTTGEYWDFVDNLIDSGGSPSVNNSNNVFEFNFIENIDNELIRLNEGFPGYTGSLLPAKKFIFRNNVFYGIEMAGVAHRPEVMFINNTFYKAAHSSGGHPFTISNARHGSAVGSIIKNNIFVENSNGVNNGWYGVVPSTEFGPVVMGESPNYNFVAGPAAQGYPAKSGFVGKETNGINGCSAALFGSCTSNSIFQNITNPVGADGKPFTADDGLRPKAGSPLCNRGSEGGYIGAYSCSGGTTILPPVTQPETPAADTLAPGISTISASSITRTSATISWITSEPATSQVQYGLTTVYGSTGALVTTLATSHTHSLAGLQPGNTYHYRVVSKDTAGNTTTSGDGVFSTLPPLVSAPQATSTTPVTPVTPVVQPVNTSVNTPPRNVPPREVSPRPVSQNPVPTLQTPAISVPLSVNPVASFISRFIPSFISNIPAISGTETTQNLPPSFVPFPEVVSEETQTSAEPASLGKTIKDVFGYVLTRIFNGFMRIFGK